MGGGGEMHEGMDARSAAVREWCGEGTDMEEGAPSCWRPPWLLTTMASAPARAAETLDEMLGRWRGMMVCNALT